MTHPTKQTATGEKRSSLANETRPSASAIRDLALSIRIGVKAEYRGLAGDELVSEVERAICGCESAAQRGDHWGAWLERKAPLEDAIRAYKGKDDMVRLTTKETATGERGIFLTSCGCGIEIDETVGHCPECGEPVVAILDVPQPFDFDAVKVPSKYLAYEGDETIWPEGRTSAGFLNTPEVRARNAEAARANDARHRSWSGYGYAEELA